MADKEKKSKKKDYENGETKEEFSIEVVAKATEETTHLADFLKFYYFLSSLNAVTNLSMTQRGAYVLPHTVMKCIGYGFAHNDSVFCVHLTGYLSEIIPQLKLTNALVCEEGITFKFMPLKFADYLVPALMVHLPIINTALYQKAQKATYIVLTQIDSSYQEHAKFEVKKVFNPPIIFDDKKEKNTDDHSNIDRMF